MERILLEVFKGRIEVKLKIMSSRWFLNNKVDLVRQKQERGNFNKGNGMSKGNSKLYWVYLEIVEVYENGSYIVFWVYSFQSQIVV